MPHRFRRWLGLAAGPDAAPASKASEVAMPSVFYVEAQPVWTKRDYAALAREGFARNAIVHRAVRLVSEAAATLPLTLLADGRIVEIPPLGDLLARPNARQTGTAFLESLYGHLLVSGNAYVQAVAIDGVPRELHALRPDRMRLVPGPDGWPAAYDYGVGASACASRRPGRACRRSCT
jgi:phage portal protein BeeE